MEQAPCEFQKKAMNVIGNLNGLFIFAQNRKETDRFNVVMEKRFVVKHLGIPTQCLGIEIFWSDKKEVGLRKTLLIDKLLAAN